MAGQVSQSESQVIYRRLCAIAKRLLDLKEEADRLFALNQSVDLAGNLEPEQGGNLTVAQVTAFVAELNGYRTWFVNNAAGPTGTEGSNARRAAIDPFILAEPLV